MVELGYTLSSEEFGPRELVTYARRAEEAGFSFLIISDHYHPWTERQGQSPFVWSVLGGVAQATQRVRVGTGVTCPTTRIHPAIIAQAAATMAVMMPGRFFLGVGSGEYLNEHIVGLHWPPPGVRLEMLEEAVDLIRAMWRDGFHSHDGAYFTMEDARIYTLPDTPPPIMVAASGPRAATLAGRIGDGMIGIKPDRDLVEKFQVAGGGGKPRYGQVTVCWAPDEAQARRTAHEYWPNVAIKGELNSELRSPRHFQQAASMVSEEDVARLTACGPDPERHVELIGKYIDAGYEHVYVHQVGPDQEGFFRFYQQEVMPRLGLGPQRQAA